MANFTPFKASDPFNMATFNSKLSEIANSQYEIGDVVTTTRPITDFAGGGQVWLPCDGSEVDETEYPELYNKLKKPWTLSSITKFDGDAVQWSNQYYNKYSFVNGYYVVLTTVAGDLYGTGNVAFVSIAYSNNLKNGFSYKNVRIGGQWPITEMYYLNGHYVFFVTNNQNIYIYCSTSLNGEFTESSFGCAVNPDYISAIYYKENYIISEGNSANTVFYKSTDLLGSSFLSFSSVSGRTSNLVVYDDYLVCASNISNQQLLYNTLSNNWNYIALDSNVTFGTRKIYVLNNKLCLAGEKNSRYILFYGDSLTSDFNYLGLASGAIDILYNNGIIYLYSPQYSYEIEIRKANDFGKNFIEVGNIFPNTYTTEYTTFILIGDNAINQIILYNIKDGKRPIGVKYNTALLPLNTSGSANMYIRAK